MKKVFLFSVFLLCGLLLSQVLPPTMGATYGIVSGVSKWLMFICLAFIMINVGREFELDKTRWKSYTADYFIAMATAAVPWIFIAIYYIFFLDSGLSWDKNLLISRFAAPTSAGILFTMLAAAGLKQEWIYKKTQVLAIFDDLDTILLMIPLQILMIGFRWQLFVIILVVCLLLIFGWKKLSSLDIPQSWRAIVIYSVCIVAAFESIYLLTKYLMGQDGAIHIEVLLPAFVLGMVIKAVHHTSVIEVRVSSFISYLFMFLVGLSTPLFIGLDTGGEAMPGWGVLIFHVVVVTFLSNLGKMFPLFFYRDRNILERLALSVGMFTRGEVGAGIIVIAMGYQLGGPALIISILSLVLNLVLTGFFVVAVKYLSQRVYGVRE
ncbi:cation:proton antiporter domain-containing protein [Sanguibacteroides justesenii]|uniref:Sodium:proton antiporter n=1 Tax=Sanguibacteroides justesenii TaxID=1547597 RepID=A0A0C3MH08_9PORP|nr:cation:proton antiporter [Sanguibacteroides justesenii]KIO45793.1 sodium:proton antiporter [Sanguibacteroides justesenii]